jgi:broad-specificity NMP kinase
MIIVLIGKMGTGKTTIANYLISNYGFKKAAFADKVKELAVDLFDMKEKNRSLLIQVAQKMKDINPNVWVNATLKKIQGFWEQNKHIIIDDCRFKNEYSALQQLNDIIFIKLEISPEEQLKRLKLLYSDYQNHLDCGQDYSENDLNEVEYDYLLQDASLEQTYKLLDHIIRLNYLNL